MSVVVCSDLHIDQSNRLDDTANSLMVVMGQAQKHKANHVLCLGDVFHRADPTSFERSLFERWIKGLVRLGIHVTLVRGNHGQRPQCHVLDMFPVLEVPGTEVVDPGRVITLDGIDIYVDHRIVREAKAGPIDYKIGRATNAPSIRDIIAQYSADYYLLGDVHKPQMLYDDPPAMYVGSVERVNFGERNEAKRIVIVHDKKKWASFDLPIRPMVQRDVGVDHVLKDDACFDGAMVKLVFGGTKEEVRRLMDRELIQRIGERAYELRIESKVIRETMETQENFNESDDVACFKQYAVANEFDKSTVDSGLAIINEAE